MKHLRRIALILLCLLLTACTQETEQVEYYCTRRIQTVGESISQTDTTYDGKGQPTSIITYINGEEVNARYLTYSEDGTTVTVNQRANGTENTGQYQRTFDEKGNMLTEDAVEDGNIISSSEYTYDEDGNVLTCVMTPSMGPKIITTSTYDAEGNRLTHEIVTDYGEEIGQTYSILREYEYNDQGHLMREVVTSGALPSDRVEYTYDPQTRTEIGTRLDSEGNSYGQIRRIYDEAGNILLEEQLDTNGEVTSYVSQTWQGSDGSISQLEDQ